MCCIIILGWSIIEREEKSLLSSVLCCEKNNCYNEKISDDLCKIWKEKSNIICIFVVGSRKGRIWYRWRRACSRNVSERPITSLAMAETDLDEASEVCHGWSGKGRSRHEWKRSGRVVWDGSQEFSKGNQGRCWRGCENLYCKKMQASKFVLMAENRDFFMLERSGHYVYISTVQDLYCTVLY